MPPPGPSSATLIGRGPPRYPLPGVDGLLTHAMIAAANAGGGICSTQRARIVRQAYKAGVVDPQDPRLRKAFNSPWPPEILAQACGNLAIGTRVYGATVFASDPEAAPVQDFLARLATHLGLPPNTVAAVQTKLRKRRVA